jgi:hypothetical protein
MFHYLLILKQTILVGALLSGLAGTILFFPLPLDSHFTCLYHQWGNREATIFHNSDAMRFYCASHTSLPSHMHLLRYYLRSYAFFWWISLALLTAGIYGFRHTKHHNQSTKPNMSDRKQ